MCTRMVDMLNKDVFVCSTPLLATHGNCFDFKFYLSPLFACLPEIQALCLLCAISNVMQSVDNLHSF